MQSIAESSLVAEEVGREEFDRLAVSWDELVARGGRDEPFYRHAFLSLWIDNFAPRERLRVFTVRAGGRLVAALPLLEMRDTMYGLPIRKLRAPANVHSNRFDLACDPARPEALAALWAHLRATQAFDVLEIPDVAEGALARGLLDLAERDGFHVGAWESMHSPFIPLEGGTAAVLGRLDGHFRSNLRRRRRKLEQKGSLVLRRVDGGLGLERDLEAALRLEQAGWKGRGGTAIADDPTTRGFYAELAQRASMRGELALYLLELDRAPVAFQFGLVCGRSYFLPKTGYDEAHRECSPGQLLMESVLADCCERGLTEFDFLGPSMPWKRDWTARERVHHWLYVFAATPRGRALRELKSRWIPTVKEVLRWRP